MNSPSKLTPTGTQPSKPVSGKLTPANMPENATMESPMSVPAPIPHTLDSNSNAFGRASMLLTRRHALEDRALEEFYACIGNLITVVKSDTCNKSMVRDLIWACYDPSEEINLNHALSGLNCAEGTAVMKLLRAMVILGSATRPLLHAVITECRIDKPERKWPEIFKKLGI